MNFLIRADASMDIGSGHIMRCLTLADQLREKGSEVMFVCRDLPGNLCDFIGNKGYVLLKLPQTSSVSCQVDVNETRALLERVNYQPDWLIVDHYALDESWEKQLRPYVSQIMVIDDLANRHHDCDVILDQNYYHNLEGRYDQLVPKDCRKLLGPKYALLRKEFYNARKKMRKRDGRVKRVLVFFGGSDATNETIKTLRAIKQLKTNDLEVDVVIGAINSNRKQIEEIFASMPNVRLHFNVSNISELMILADLAIGAGGTTTWERCFLGLPTIVIVVAKNQLAITRALADNGVVQYLGFSSEVNSNDIAEAINKMLQAPELLVKMGNACFNLMDENIAWLENAFFKTEKEQSGAPT